MTAMADVTRRAASRDVQLLRVMALVTGSSAYRVPAGRGGMCKVVGCSGSWRSYWEGGNVVLGCGAILVRGEEGFQGLLLMFGRFW
jgi:hypothetical protein